MKKVLSAILIIISVNLTLFAGDVTLIQHGSNVNSWSGEVTGKIDNSDWSSSGGLYIDPSLFGSTTATYRFTIPASNIIGSISNLRVSVYGKGNNWAGEPSLSVGGRVLSNSLPESEGEHGSYSIPLSSLNSTYENLPGTWLNLSLYFGAFDVYDIKYIKVQYSINGIDQEALENYQSLLNATQTLFNSYYGITHDGSYEHQNNWPHAVASTEGMEKTYMAIIPGYRSVILSFNPLLSAVNEIPGLVKLYQGLKATFEDLFAYSDFMQACSVFFENEDTLAYNSLVNITNLWGNAISDNGTVDSDELPGIESTISDAVSKVNKLESKFITIGQNLKNIKNNNTDEGVRNCAKAGLILLSPMVKFNPDTGDIVKGGYISSYKQSNNQSLLVQFLDSLRPVQVTSLTVNITPSSAYWKIFKTGYDSGWQFSGSTLFNLDVGNYTLELYYVAGYNTPPSRTITISTGTNTQNIAYVAAGKYTYVSTIFGEDYDSDSHQIVNPATSFTYPDDFDQITMAIRLEDVYKNGDYSPLVKVKCEYYRPDGSFSFDVEWDPIEDPWPDDWYGSFTCYDVHLAEYYFENNPGQWSCKIYVNDEGSDQLVDTKYFNILRKPFKATNPSPANSSTDISISPNLSWSDGGGATSYKVYFGTDSTPDSGEDKGYKTVTTFNPGTLQYSQTYYWRIDARNSIGTTTGDLWSFTTLPDTFPPANPANCSTDSLPEAIQLSWTNPSDSDFANILILRSNSPVSASLSDGSAYSVGSAIGNALVVYNGPAESYLDPGLEPLDNYFFRLYSYDNLKNYSDGVAVTEYTQAQPDIIYNGMVDLFDFSQLAAQWLNTACSSSNNWCDKSDIDHSGIVEINDLNLFVYNWLLIKPAVYVDSTATGSNTGTSWDNAYTTIELALNNAVYGDIIWVAQGTYDGRITLPGGVALYGGFSGSEKSIYERNWSSNESVIDGGVDIAEGADSNTRIDGFTITNGVGNSGKGGGVYIINSSPIVINNKIVNNTVNHSSYSFCYAYGGGVYSSGGSPQILNNLISQNNVYSNAEEYAVAFGGGVYLSGGSATVVNNTIVDNYLIADTIYVVSMAEEQGAGIYETSDECLIANCIIWGNVGETFSGGTYYIASSNADTSADLLNCCLEGGYAGMGNITIDPLFVNPDSGDYRLQADSNCINTGDKSYLPAWCNSDLASSNRVSHNQVDMGAYEFSGDLQVVLPVLTPDAGLYNTEQSVLVSCVNTDVEIHYTIDGSDPTLDSPIIVSGNSIHLDHTQTINVKAWKNGYLPSRIKSADYQLKVATPALSVNSGTYNSEQVVTVTCVTPGAVMHYTIDGTEPTENDLIINDGDTISIDKSLILKVKAWYNLFEPSNTRSNSYNLVVATPAFTPDADVYQEAQNVTITCATPGADIHYTTDGSDPDENDTIIVSGDSILVEVIPATVLKAKAFKTNFVASATKSAEYRGPNIYYVSPTGDDANDGLSWSAAKQTISGTLSISGNNDHLWVSAGIYSGRISVPDGVALYGGFAGNEILLSQRYWAVNETVISGGVNIASGAASHTRVDGFTITNGYAENGGGVYVSNSSPIIVNNVIVGNVAEGYDWWSSGLGGGVFVAGGSPIICNNIIKGNSSKGFYYNDGMMEEYGLGQGGGIYLASGASQLVNNTVVGNSASVIYFNEGRGGGVYISSGEHVIINSIIYGNTANSSPQIGGSCDVSYSDIQGGYSGDNNIDIDPGFIDPSNSNYQLSDSSPCIDLGSDSDLPDWLTLDLLGNPRNIDIINTGNEGINIIDIGAYEYQGP